MPPPTHTQSFSCPQTRGDGLLPISADESESRARAKLPASPSGEDLPRGRAQVPDPEARGRRPASAPRTGQTGPHGHGGGRPARRAVHLRRQDSGPRCQGPSTTGLRFSATHNAAPSEGSGAPPRSTGKGRWQAPLPIGTPASRHAHGPAPNTRVRPERNAQCNPLFLTKNEQTKTLTFPRT